MRIKLAIVMLFIAVSAQASIRYVPKVPFTSSTPTGTDYTADVNCMGAWAMAGDGSASESDVSGEGQTLAVSAGDTIPTSATVPAGYTGAARDFEDTENDYLFVAESNGSGVDISGVDQSISIAAWVQVETISADGWIVAKWDTSSGNRQYGLRYDSSDSRIYFVLSSDGTATSAQTSATTPISEGVYTHIVAVYNDTDMRIYVNGSLANTPAAYTAGIFNSTSTFWIGARNGGNEPFDGLIYEASVYDRALSAAEALEMYQYGMRGTNN